MIFIDLTDFLPNDQWRYEAWLLKAELLLKSNNIERKQFIDDNRDFWSSLKKDLPYNDKCWYSEAKESVSVYEIEHFRPIKATTRSTSLLKKLDSFLEAQRRDWIKETKYRGAGYWWLAFDYTNFRHCGKQINLIKSTRFPLGQDSFIAYNVEDNYASEDAILLDPVRKGDSDLLTFDPDGKARPISYDENSIEYFRAYVSIEIYGFNNIDSLVRHRETKWSDCYKAIKRATDKFVELEEASDDGNTERYYKLFDEFMDFVKNDIKPAIDPSSEFSAVAKACVLSFSKYQWIEKFILVA